jgi:hypothetical protein
VMKSVSQKNGDILHFHQCLQATDGPETCLKAQECGHSLIQPSDPKDPSTNIATTDDAAAVAPDYGSRREWHTHALASSSAYQEM